MRILYVSHSGLPDARIERVAWSAKKRGYTAYFAGPKGKGFSFSQNPFEEIFVLPWSRATRLYFPINWAILKRKFKKILNDVRPDVVHAHNIFSAKLVSDFGIPFVFDDHEYLSAQVRALLDSRYLSIRQKLTRKYSVFLWGRWEKEIASSSTPIITANENIAKRYIKLGSNKVFVVPNMPCEVEVKNIPNVKSLSPPHFLSAVYVEGPKTPIRTPLPFRNFLDTIKLFKKYNWSLTIIGDPNYDASPPIYSLGYLPRLKLLKEMIKHNIGLLTWKPHWFHKYCDPNKAYDYAHCGLLTLAISSLETVVKRLKNCCMPFTNYNELVDVLFDLKDNIDSLNERREKIQNFARRKLIWELFESQIFEAYKYAG